MKSNWLTKDEYKTALEEGRVFLSAAMKTRNGVTGYNVYIQENGTMHSVFGHSSYWSDKRECYHVTAWGTSRSLEVILSIGYTLGLKFSEIKQNYNVL